MYRSCDSEKVYVTERAVSDPSIPVILIDIDSVEPYRRDVVTELDDQPSYLRYHEDHFALLMGFSFVDLKLAF